MRIHRTSMSMEEIAPWGEMTPKWSRAVRGHWWVEEEPGPLAPGSPSTDRLIPRVPHAPPQRHDGANDAATRVRTGGVNEAVGAWLATGEVAVSAGATQRAARREAEVHD
jgi:hypothetical protein